MHESFDKLRTGLPKHEPVEYPFVVSLSNIRSW
jgi:hypothetical protein